MNAAVLEKTNLSIIEKGCLFHGSRVYFLASSLACL
jgi:hypothetical protein